MKALEFIYQDVEIHFLLENEKEVMVNATEMAKAFDKRVDHFTKSQHYKDFISVAILPPNGGRINVKTESDLVSNQGRNGIYFHKILALKFAAWLDPNFEFWVYSTIDEILFGSAKAVGKKLTEKEKAKKELTDFVQKIYETNNADAIELLNKLQNVKNLEKEATKEFSNFKKQYTIFD